MLSRGLLFFTDIPLTLVGMALFLLAFAAMTAVTLMTSKRFYQEIANQPLSDEGDL